MIDDLETRFAYYPPQTRERQKAHEDCRATVTSLARVWNTMLPDGREKSLAITKLEEALFWANAAIARSPQD